MADVTELPLWSSSNEWGCWERCLRTEKSKCHSPCRMENPANCRLASLTSVPGRTVALVFVEIISRHGKDKKMTGNS